jgi:hypothetical protein
MKAQFIQKGQTKFNTPKAAFGRKGSMRRYTKKVVLALGASVVVRDSSEPTEEGHSAVYEVMENVNGVLHREISTNSSDCDGSYSSECEQKLVDGAWHNIDSSQRDHRAESMGY